MGLYFDKYKLYYECLNGKQLLSSAKSLGNIISLKFDSKSEQNLMYKGFAHFFVVVIFCLFNIYLKFFLFLLIYYIYYLNLY